MVFRFRHVLVVSALFFLSVSPVLAATGTDDGAVRAREPRFSLVTMAPAGEIYLAFGHSMLRYVDPSDGTDITFNYGSFSMEDPLFIARFVYGYMNYSIVAYRFAPYFRAMTERTNVVFTEQDLDLEPRDVEALYRFLMWNILPENKHYLYDFIADNCATRITDALQKVLGDRLVLLPQEGNDYRRTYRQELDDHIARRPFWQFLFYLVVGSASDRPVPLERDDWLPSHLAVIAGDAMVRHEDGLRPLVTGQRRLWDPVHPTDWDSQSQDPAFVLWPLAAIAALFLWRSIRKASKGSVLRRRLPVRLMDFLIFLVIGLMGLVVWYMNFLSIHSAVKENWNCLWTSPLVLLMAVALLFRRPPRWLLWAGVVQGAAFLLPLVAFPLWPQGMHPVMVPFLLLPVLRLASWLTVHRERWMPVRTPSGKSADVPGTPH